MSDVVIKVENLGKQYRLGQVGTGTISHDLNRWWHKVRGKDDPYLKIGEANDRSTKGDSNLVWALKDINFEVKQGEVLGIIGKNGAGKSTLLKILSRVTGPTVGDIKVKGRIASLLEVGTGFHPELTGRENIFLNGAILGMTKQEIKSKFDEIVNFSGVERYIDTPVKRYSSGMYVRLAFAVAAHLEPEILIVDEVLAVGDAEFQKKCMGKMKDVAGQGRTILFVSHNMVAVEAICNSAAVLNNGKIGFIGEVNQAIKYYFTDSNNLITNENLEGLTRSGSGNLKFERVVFYDENMKSIKAPISGKRLIVGLHYKTFNKNLKNIRVGIAINNGIYGTQLTVLANDITDEIFSSVPEEGIFLCDIPKLSIVSGQYNLNLFCSVNDVISDWLTNVCSFNVEAGNYYNTGRNMDSGQSQFLMDYEWKYDK
jgi:lipopolysaccharide transport system ATP-binding protein